MKFDYSKQFKMMENVPNLNPLFGVLKNNATTLKRRSDKVGFFFFLLCGTLLTMTYFNIDHHMFSNDYSHRFKILPDYITGTVLVTYRKERRQFILY
jgi:hypothetical protein